MKLSSCGRHLVDVPLSILSIVLTVHEKSDSSPGQLFRHAELCLHQHALRQQ